MICHNSKVKIIVCHFFYKKCLIYRFYVTHLIHNYNTLVTLEITQWSYA